MKTTDEQKEIWTKVYVRLTAAERRVADDISARSHESASHELRWAEELLSLVELLTTLDTPVPWMASSLFWVRVHGVVREFIQYNRQQADWARTLTEAERSQSLARFSQAIFEASQAMLASLTEEEVVVADYLRQRNAHLRLSAYALSLNKKRDVRSDRTIEQLGKTYSIAEVDQMRAALQARHGGEAAFAHYVACKIQPSAQQLVYALRELHSLK